jgi:hypothetical protein
MALSTSDKKKSDISLNDDSNNTIELYNTDFSSTVSLTEQIICLEQN